MTTHGIKVSYPGKDISSANPEDFALHSSYGTIKILDKFSGTLTVPTMSTATATINHGFSFTPMVLFWVELEEGGGRWWFGGTERASGVLDSDIYIDRPNTICDGTKFDLTLGNKIGVDRDIDYVGFFIGGDESSDVSSLISETYGIKASADGADIDTTDIGEILLHPDFPMLKYHSSTTPSGTISAGDTELFVPVSHNLGYVPAFLVYVEFAWFSSLQFLVPFGIASNPVIVTAYANTTTIWVSVNQIIQGSDRDYNFRVIVFKDQLV